MRDMSLHERYVRYQELGATATSDNSLVVKQSQVVFVSVKPDMVSTVLQQVKPVVSKDNLFISICMGITIADLEKVKDTKMRLSFHLHNGVLPHQLHRASLLQHLPPGTRVVRAMPNTPALVGRGASVYTCGTAAQPDDGDTARKLLGAVGIAHQVQEKLVDPVTALSGSGPAYVSAVRYLARPRCRRRHAAVFRVSLEVVARVDTLQTSVCT